MTFSSKKTKATVLAQLASALGGLGYVLFRTDPSTLRAEFRRNVNDDVLVGIQVEFCDGVVASKTLTNMQASFGVRSAKLLSIYCGLHGQPFSDAYLPIGGFMRGFAPDGNARLWSFEVPNRMEHAEEFRAAVEGLFHRLLQEYDSAEKQIARLTAGNDAHVHWNDLFFVPVAHLYLGQFDAARAVAKRALDSARTPAFAASYQSFYQRVVQAGVRTNP
jgi:hypothetical protein